MEESGSKNSTADSNFSQRLKSEEENGITASSRRCLEGKVIEGKNQTLADTFKFEIQAPTYFLYITCPSYSMTLSSSH